MFSSLKVPSMTEEILSKTKDFRSEVRLNWSTQCNASRCCKFQVCKMCVYVCVSLCVCVCASVCNCGIQGWCTSEPVHATQAGAPSPHRTSPPMENSQLLALLRRSLRFQVITEYSRKLEWPAQTTWFEYFYSSN